MKKNIRSIPQNVRRRIREIGDRAVVAGCARQFTAESLRNGGLAHLHIELRDDGLHYLERIVPSAQQGKYSRRNTDGWDEVRTDLPLETREHPVESPNWGDSFNGTHTVWLPTKAYPRDFHPPRELELVIHCANPAAGQAVYAIAARVDEVLSQASPDFDERLLEDLNILQENLGACGAEPADSSVADYTRTLHLAWDILPPGSRDEALQRLFRGRQPTQEVRDTASSRYDFFETLAPRQIIVGTSGFRRYFGALLEDNLVVFENVQYGNAVYLMYDNWQDLSHRSRIDLISGRVGHQFDRVIHKDGWQDVVRSYVQVRRGN